ncbi:hypothetical protein Bca4012_032505 [Brassica carinata]
MGNCCGSAGSLAKNDNNKPTKGRKKQNPFSIDYGLHHGNNGGGKIKSLKLIVLTDPIGRKISQKYKL